MVFFIGNVHLSMQLGLIVWNCKLSIVVGAHHTRQDCTSAKS